LKKGCFLKFIIIFTITLAVTVYLVQNKFEEIFLNPGKELLINALEQGWEDNIDKLKESSAKDSLKTLLENYITKMKSTEDLSSDQTKEIIKSLEKTFKDNNVDPEELNRVRELIEAEL
jgi:hypothetical protein